MSGFNFPKFINVSEALKRADERRKNIDPNSLCKYPLKCLNDFLFGMLPSELVVIGADAGVGKSQIAEDIAWINAKDKKKVYLISLEGDKDEVINRWKWKIICQQYYSDFEWMSRGIRMAYALYVSNQIKGIEQLEQRAEEEIRSLQGYLEIFDRTVNFDVSTLVQQILSIKDDAQLIVIDHLHYFSLVDAENEATQISRIMRTIKDLTERYSIPVVLISHLRKKAKDRGVPDNEDFMGSSNIAKVASTAIVLSTLYEENRESEYATIVRITKNRQGIRSDIGFLTMFQLFKKEYNDDYRFVKIDSFNRLELLKEQEIPKWCQSFLTRS